MSQPFTAASPLDMVIVCVMSTLWYLPCYVKYLYDVNRLHLQFDVFGDITEEPVAVKEFFVKRSIGVVLLQISVALFLLVSGITGLLSSSAGDLAPVVEFFNSLFRSSSVLTVMIIILSISQIIGGFFLITELFTTDLRITDMILVILIILWIINIVLVDFVGPFGSGSILRSTGSLLRYLGTLSSHLMVLGALVLVTKKYA